jgi:hypothetical protein
MVEEVMEIDEDEVVPVTTRARMFDPRLVAPQITVCPSIARFPVVNAQEETGELEVQNCNGFPLFKAPAVPFTIYVKF